MNSIEYYNEIFDRDGLVRPHYCGIYSQWEKVPKTKRRRLHKRSGQFFAWEYSQDPFPRVLTNNESEHLRRGVAQRARAIREFLCDYSSRGKRWRSIMPAYLLNSIIGRHHNKNLLRQMDPELISFPYGPDVIRNKNGEWRIVEDSAGLIGGLGDILQNRKALFKLFPKFRDSLTQINEPAWFFQELVAHYFKQATLNDGIPLLYLRDYRLEFDQETRRLAATFKKLGIEVTTPSDGTKKIVFEKGNPYLKSPGSKQKIGYLILHASPEQIEAQSFFVLLQQLKDRKLNLKNVMSSYNTSLLTKCLLQGKVRTNFSPGVQFVNDKIFGLYIDSMIRKYLVEEPILKTIPAQGFCVKQTGGEWKIDKKLIDLLQREKSQYVIKKVDEDGGTGVWIGEKESKKSLDKLIQKIQLQPEKYIIQNFEHLSVLENRIVDLRIHAHVDYEQVIVSNTPWGRANWLSGDGKVNISTKGFASPVVVLAK